MISQISSLWYLCSWSNLDDFVFGNCLISAVAQDVPHQEEAGEEDEAEQANPPLDPHEDWQHHQVFIIIIFFFFSDLSFPSFDFSFFFVSSTRCEILRYNAKRRHWRRTKLGFWDLLSFQLGFFFFVISKTWKRESEIGFSGWMLVR